MTTDRVLIQLSDKTGRYLVEWTPYEYGYKWTVRIMCEGKSYSTQTDKNPSMTTAKYFINYFPAVKS